MSQHAPGWAMTLDPDASIEVDSTPTTKDATTEPLLDFVWLELLGKCQLACSHCYAQSGRPAATAP
jgi:hypothetical protein